MLPLRNIVESRNIRIIASILLAFFLLWRAVVFWFVAFHGFAWDYSINWTAAHALRAGISPYDQPAMQALAAMRIDQGMQQLFTGRFNSYLGLPTTAILHLPFTLLPFDTSVQVYRALALFAMCAAIFLTGAALPVAQRRKAWLTGVVCLLTWHAFPQSLQLGQVDAWVMLSLAVTLFAVSRQRWLLAGIALAVAVLLKISPIWLLLYCLLRRQWQILWPAGIGLVAALLVSCLPGQGAELIRFVTDILPGLGDSPLHPQNQSLGAALARLASGDMQAMSFAAGIGVWKFAAVAVCGLLLGVQYCKHDKQNPIQATELSAVLLLALLAGPLTWDHYLSWAVLPVMLLAASLPLLRLLLLLFVLLPLAWPVAASGATFVASHGHVAWLASLQMFSVLLLALGMIMTRFNGKPYGGFGKD